MGDAVMKYSGCDGGSDVKNGLDLDMAHLTKLLFCFLSIWIARDDVGLFLYLQGLFFVLMVMEIII